MNKTMAYCKPTIAVRGSVAEMICGPLIKDRIGIIEAISWRILPAYELDEEKDAPPARFVIEY